MNDVYVEAFNNKTFNQAGNESGILKLKFHNPAEFLFQQLPVKEKVKNIENNRLRKGYIIDTLTSVDIRKIVEMDGKVIDFYEALIYGENFKISPFRKVKEKLFTLRQK